MIIYDPFLDIVVNPASRRELRLAIVIYGIMNLSDIRHTEDGHRQ